MLHFAIYELSSFLFDSQSQANLQSIVKDYYKRIQDLESKKWDLERATRVKEIEVSSEIEQ